MPTQVPAPEATPAGVDASEGETDSQDASQADEVEAAVDWRAFVPADTADHLATMDRAARESDCGVPWQLLAAIARVESDFGRNMSTSSAGAIGYGQFLPSSWHSFGSDGNAYDYRDALPAIALYLCQSGLERDPRSALFAYNHADWYVDLVLDLAVRYDRMAPGAPTPAVLGVGPAREEATKIEYAPGRNLQLQTRARRLESGARWLGVPWRGRAAGQPIAAQALGATALNTLQLAFGMKPSAIGARDVGNSEHLRLVADAAWDAGLLALPGAAQQWTAPEVRQALRLGHPVVVFVGSRGLPGHPPDEDDGEQPLVLIGTTPDGFIYNDPTFSSSLGYGMALSETDLLKFWDAAARPRQALAFVAKPRALMRQAHLAEAAPPEPIARVTATPAPTDTPVPAPTATAVVLPPTIEPTAVAPTPAPVVAAPQAQSEPGPSMWLVIALTTSGGAAAGAFGLKRRRGARPR